MLTPSVKLSFLSASCVSEGFRLGLKLDINMPPFERKLRYFLYNLCVDWGFCIPPSDTDRITSSSHVLADEFAVEIVRAEGFSETEGSDWVKKITLRFIEHFGTNELFAD